MCINRRKGQMEREREEFEAEGRKEQKGIKEERPRV